MQHNVIAVKFLLELQWEGHVHKTASKKWLTSDKNCEITVSQFSYINSEISYCYTENKLQMYYYELAMEWTTGIQFPVGGGIFPFATMSGTRPALYSMRTRSKKGRMWIQPFAPASAAVKKA